MSDDDLDKIKVFDTAHYFYKHMKEGEDPDNIVIPDPD